MIVWRAEQGRNAATSATLRLLKEVERALAPFAPRGTRVSSIRIGAGPNDLHDLEVAVEFARGAVLVVRYRSVDEQDRDPAAVGELYDAVAALVGSHILEAKTIGFENLADLLHDARSMARGMLASWRRDGIEATIDGIRYVADEYSSLYDELPVEAWLHCLDDRLRPSSLTIYADQPAKIEAELARLEARLRKRATVLAVLAEHDADGMVDQLVLNALALHGAGLGELALNDIEQWHGWLPRTTLFVEDGCLGCYGSDGSGLRWSGSAITIVGRAAPATVLTALIGKPITRLVEHPLLSDNMIITEAYNGGEDGAHLIHATFDQPRRLFCSRLGQAWDALR